MELPKDSINTLLSVIKWLSTDRTGTSSKALCSFMFNCGEGHFPTPWDMGDFGRCYQFITCHKGIKEMFREMDLSPMGQRWVKIQENFDELEYLYTQYCAISGIIVGVDYSNGMESERLKETNKKFREILDLCNKQEDKTDNAIHIKL